MTLLQGLGVSPGIGIGTAFILKKRHYSIPHHTIVDVQTELLLFQAALETVIQDTQKLLTQSTEQQIPLKTDILQAYLMLLEDPTVTEQVRNLIKKQHNAIHATNDGMDIIIQLFQEMDDDYIKERAYDIEDIKNRILDELLEIKPVDISRLPPDTILVAQDLSTSDTAKLNITHITGILTQLGGQNSHTSIMAKSFEIPAIVGIDNLLNQVANHDLVLLDGLTGQTVINPTSVQQHEFNIRKKHYLKEKSLLHKYKDCKTTAIDGHILKIYANITTPSEISYILESGADGIGLFRSEFLYIDNNDIPSEEVQFQAYYAAIIGMNEKPVIVRTMDVGGDKTLPCLGLSKESNPFLGYRAIRICLDQTDLFKTQLRALLRASHYGNLKIMFPMISCLDELRQAKKMVQQVMEQLTKQAIPYNKNIPIGIMIEIPSAALISDSLAKECDFFSIGTNDLIQYTIAVDRCNKKVSHLYTPYHPAVLKLIAQTITAAHEAGITCGMCGEAAGDPLLTPIWLSMGLDEFSMNSSQILKIRSILYNLDLVQAQALSTEISALPTAHQIQNCLKDFSDKLKFID